MLIYTDILTEEMIRERVPVGCYLAPHYDRKRDWASVHVASARKRERVYSVRLSGASKHTMQNLPDRTATWDEWGIFIDALFKLDPEAVIGPYKSRENFMEVTRSEHERISEHRPDILHEHRAPWLHETLTYEQVLAIFQATDAAKEV